ncbi:hypothetical protein DVH24_017725 [Malus domestica]|uniref:Uncharacterized protein n=1 Tax=Malus domestica TaxID=3750 RepID=A0A498KK11_MALDO|nr:hypothetical protein DVH24_017725 [Malus domestica]
MAFVFGLFLGILVGLAIILLFVRFENHRSKLRSELATTVAAFARMTVEDSRKLLPPEFYPSWVVFSHRQKLSSQLSLSHQNLRRLIWHGSILTSKRCGLMSMR